MKIYDRMEKGEINRREQLELSEESVFNLKRFPDIGIVRLFGRKNTETENINLEMTEQQKQHNSDSDQEIDEKASQETDFANYRTNVDVVSYSEKK